MMISLEQSRVKSKEYRDKTHLFGIRILLRQVHRPRRRGHHMRHAVHRVVGLDLRRRQLRHVRHLVHLLRQRLLGQQHLGLLVRLLRLALFQQVLDLLLEDGVLLGGLLGLAPGLFGLEARLELDLHVAGELAVGHCGWRRFRIVVKIFGETEMKRLAGNEGLVEENRFQKANFRRWTSGG